MGEADGVDHATVIIDRALVFLDRPEVVEQLLVLAGVLVVSAVVSRTVWWVLDKINARFRPGGRLVRFVATGLTGVMFQI
ncbi:MAG: hypothetical protein ACE5GB_05060, partial [Acidimicrobiales bacterium]